MSPELKQDMLELLEDMRERAGCNKETCPSFLAGECPKRFLETKGACITLRLDKLLKDLENSS